MFLTAQFTAAEILSLLGLVQSVYVLVYMLLRSGSVWSAAVPSLYFLSLGAAFLLDAAAGRWQDDIVGYETFQWLFWFACIPLGTLLVFQVADVTRPVPLKNYLLLLLVPLAFLPALFIDDRQALYVSGLVFGALALLAIWLRRGLLDGLHGNPRFGEERFWLIIALIVLNVAFLASTLAYVSHGLGMDAWVLVRTLLGIAFVYIASTSLFRIYPQVFKKRDNSPAVLNAAEQAVLGQLDTLMTRDKIYQEASYGRAELARELQIGEAALSRLVNLRYGKTIPQLLNELRVSDAQKLLRETDVPIQNVFEESGFNSITTFNRVFKELSGDVPKDYRARFRS